jgi:hypothetical protein
MPGRQIFNSPHPVSSNTFCPDEATPSEYEILLILRDQESMVRKCRAGGGAVFILGNIAAPRSLNSEAPARHESSAPKAVYNATAMN